MKFTPLTLDHLTPWAELLAVAFERQPDQMCQLLHYLQPETQLVAWGAWDGERLAAQYSCLRRELYLPTLAHCVPVGLSINMAVHPNYRGRGLVKQVAEPVYAALTAQGVAAGVGFSNAAGVRVDKNSSGYGYRVIGKLGASLFWPKTKRQFADFQLTTVWPTQPFVPSLLETAVQFAWNPNNLRQRFASHPFREYQFGVWQKNETIVGIVVYRPILLGGQLPGVALLAAYSQDLEELLRRWLGVVKLHGYHLVHLVSTPNSAVFKMLRKTAVYLPQPTSRTQYYLTLKPLQSHLPQTILSFKNWSCLGGDVL